jgi:hypothetical protein
MMDVIALVGTLRYREHRSVPEIHRELDRRGGQPAQRDQPARALRRAGRRLGRHGGAPRNPGAPGPGDPGDLQPDVGHEVLWVIRECLSGLVLLARSLLSSTATDLAGLLREVADDLAAIGIAVAGVVSDGQSPIRLPRSGPRCRTSCVTSTTWARRRCRFMRPTGTPRRKAVRGVRPIERTVEGRDDEAARIVLGYCAAVRSALTDDGPLEAAGLRLHDRLERIEASLGRIEEKGGACRPS